MTYPNDKIHPEQFLEGDQKPTLNQVAYVFAVLNKYAGGSFRKVIYDGFGASRSDYSLLNAAGGMWITNAMQAEDAEEL